MRRHEELFQLVEALRQLRILCRLGLLHCLCVDSELLHEVMRQTVHLVLDCSKLSCDLLVVGSLFDGLVILAEADFGDRLLENGDFIVLPTQTICCWTF